MSKRAIVLLSGGLDSATALAIAKDEGFETYALSFSYGQRQEQELFAARHVATTLGVTEHRIIEIDLRAFGGSALTDDIEVPKDQDPKAGGIPVTYVPARNTIFLSYALAWAEVVGASDIFIGVNALDYSGYPDCRPEYIDAFNKLIQVGSKAGDEGLPVTIQAPLVSMSKVDIIKRGHSLGVDYRMTHSCYDPVADMACGRCDACQLRREGFVEAGIEDPTRYVPQEASAWH